MVCRGDSASKICPSNSSLLIGAGILVACPSDISGRLSPDSLGTAKDSSTHRGTSNKVRVGLLRPTNRGDRSPSDVSTALPALAGPSLLPALLLCIAPPASFVPHLASFVPHLAAFVAHLASFVALLASFVPLLASSSVLLASSSAFLASSAAPPALSAAHIALFESSPASAALPVPRSGALEPLHAAVSPQALLWPGHREGSQHQVSSWPEGSHSLSPAAPLPGHPVVVPSGSSPSISLAVSGPGVLSPRHYLPRVLTKTMDAFEVLPQCSHRLRD